MQAVAVAETSTCFFHELHLISDSEVHLQYAVEEHVLVAARRICGQHSLLYQHDWLV